MHPIYWSYFPFGLKKLVILAIELVLTFFNASTPREPVDAFRLAAAAAALSLLEFEGGMDAASVAAVMLAR